MLRVLPDHPGWGAVPGSPDAARGTLEPRPDLPALPGGLGLARGDVRRAYVLREVYEELEEHWNEGYKSVPFARLIAGMRRKWHGGRDPVPTGMREMAESMMQRAVR